MKLTPWMLTVATFLMVGLLAGAFVLKKLNAREVPPPAETTLLPMALTDLEPGTLVTDAHLGQGPWRAGGLPPDTLRSTHGVVGRVVRERIRAAEPLRSTAFYQPGERPPLQIREGMRAVSVSVRERAALVNGLVRPGEFVDVHLTVDGSASETMTVTLFQGVKVLTLGTAGAGPGAATTVTLELTPRQSRAILLARDKGEIALTYTPEGEGTGETGGPPDRVTLPEILGTPPSAVRPFVTEQFRSSGRAEARFYDGLRMAGPEERQSGLATSDPGTRTSGGSPEQDPPSRRQ